MHYEVLFLSLTTSLLNLGDERRDSAFRSVESSFEGLEFRKMQVPGHTSIGARVRPDTDLPLYEWIESMRKQGLRRAGVPSFQNSSDLEGLLDELTPMQLQAYHGGSLKLIACEFQSQTKFYVLEMESSAPHLMTALQFGDFLNDQPVADVIWKALLVELKKSDESEVSSSENIRDYFYTRAGARAFASSGDSLLLAAQSAAQGAGVQLLVSDAEREFLGVGDNAESLHEMLGGAPEEFISYEDMLVLNGSVTPSELARLFDAQICGPAVWERVAASLVRIGEMKEGLKPAEWRKSFLSLEREKVDVYARSFIQALQEACRACNCTVRITDEFNGRLETYLESLDTQARIAHVPSDQRLHFTPNREPWNHFYFSELGAIGSSAGSKSSGVNSDKLELSIRVAQQAMRLGYAFSTRIGSAYAKIFALTNLLLSEESDSLVDGRMGIEDFLFEIQTQGHDHEMQERLESAWPLMELLRDLQMKPLQIKALLASSVADVFDGLGEWSDSYFEDPADQKEFEEISQMVFKAIQTLQTAALSIESMNVGGTSQERGK